MPAAQADFRFVLILRFPTSYVNMNNYFYIFFYKTPVYSPILATALCSSLRLQPKMPGLLTPPAPAPATKLVELVELEVPGVCV